MDAYELEGIVEELYARAGAGPLDVWRPTHLAKRLGVRIVRLRGLPKRGELSRLNGSPIITLRDHLPEAIDEWTTGHELGHFAGLPDGSEREADYVGAAIQLRRRPFLRALHEGADWLTLSERFATTSTSVVLRVGELEGRPLAVVTPARSYGRGDAEWPDDPTLRRWVRHGAPGIVRARLPDDPKRWVLEGMRDYLPESAQISR